jgi:hypothetical protein
LDLDLIISKLLELKAQGASRAYFRARHSSALQRPVKLDRDREGDVIIIGE